MEKKLLKYLMYMPIGYTLLTRVIDVSRRKISFYYLTDFLLIIPVILFYDFRAFAFISLVISIAIAYFYYEVFYIVNDLWTTKYEDIPTLRGPGISIKLTWALLIRLAMFTVVLTAIILTSSLSLYELLLLTMILVYLAMIAFIHNMIRDKLKRNPTHALMRLMRWLLITLLFSIVQNIKSLDIMKDVALALIPHVVSVELGYLLYNLKRMGARIPEIKVRLSLSYGIYIPLLVILLHNPLQVGGYLFLVMASIIKMLREGS